ncbi:MAG: group II intron reverse transcriptase/maturase [Coleofasciculus sp. S288]|nr:group II intron reverse transcriptase/maturase [Coleofasciculus sp. S288]
MEWDNDIPVCKGADHMEWKNIPWKHIEKRVFKLQKRIYRAAKRGDVRVVRKLQKILMQSWSARCLAVRQVTQDNKGKKTAGVDGKKNLTPKQRLTLIKNLRIIGKSKPARRIWIPKPGKDEKRPLSIPTIHDRALQALVKLALEPEWESKFEPNSYGFRPGRSCHDAVGQIYLSINKQPKFVLDADIAKCFDKINHKALLEKLNTFPTLRRQIRSWLEAGAIDEAQLIPTSEGTPQGGVISPLLANIALHGMEELTKKVSKTACLVRYADDFVILDKDITVVQRCKEAIEEFLKGMGLELKDTKTRISHTLQKYEGNVGFDFLGFNIRQYKVGKCHYGKTGGRYESKILDFKTNITPSKEALKKHTAKVGKIVHNHKDASQAALIKHLNPVIRGWSNYYSCVVSKKTFSKADKNTYQQIRAWVVKRRGRNHITKVMKKYFHTINGRKWVFSTREDNNPLRLLTHAETPIVRHKKVVGEKSPYDGDTLYWSERMGKHPEVPKIVATLLKAQKGKCAHCGLLFKDGDNWEIDHIIRTTLGGNDNVQNKHLLHRHCHDYKTARDKQVAGNKELERYLDQNPF